MCADTAHYCERGALERGEEGGGKAAWLVIKQSSPVQWYSWRPVSRTENI